MWVVVSGRGVRAGGSEGVWGVAVDVGGGCSGSSNSGCVWVVRVGACACGWSAKGRGV